MTWKTPENEFEALLYLQERLQRRFPEWDENALRGLIAEALETFDDARFRDYVPVLVEHRVLRTLRSSHSHAA